jgi:quinol monooxygenase YgiN
MDHASNWTMFHSSQFNNFAKFAKFLRPESRSLQPLALCPSLRESNQFEWQLGLGDLMYVVVAKWYAKEENIANVKEILQTMMTESQSEPGCVMYIANQGLDDARRFLIYEQYRDEAAFQEHLETPAFKEHVQGRVAPMLETRAREIYTTIE